MIATAIGIQESEWIEIRWFVVNVIVVGIGNNANDVHVRIICTVCVFIGNILIFKWSYEYIIFHNSIFSVFADFVILITGDFFPINSFKFIFVSVYCDMTFTPDMPHD